MKLIIKIPKRVHVTTKEMERIIDADNEVVAEAIKNSISLEDIRTEIDREATYYEAEVNTDIAEGLYKAIEIIDRHMGGEDT